MSQGKGYLLSWSRLRSEQERALVAGLTSLARKAPRYPLVTDYFDEAAANFAERTAVTWGSQTLTYGELKRQTDKLAAFLRRQGIVPNTNVLILLPKGIDLMLATLAVLKAGAAYVPGDVDYPAERIQRIVEKAGVTAAITTPEHLEQLADAAADGAGKLICLDPCPAEAMRGIDRALLLDDVRATVVETDGDVQCLKPLVNSDEPVYVHFTSGTTGEPKGIVNSHRSVCHLIEWFLNDSIYRTGDHVPQLVSYAFEAFAAEVFPALAVGATLHIFPSLKTVTPAQVLDEFAARRISVATISPSYALQLFRRSESDNVPALPRLRSLLFGGETLLPRHVETIRNALGERVALINTYGPTEATVHAMAYRIPPLPAEQIPIGQALPGRKILIVDPNGFICEPDAPGEIWIGGQGLASGYIGDAERTRQVFVLLETAPGKFERFYRTGDMGAMDREGMVYFLGRRDNQVKVHGQRVEVDEIEKVLAQHPEVQEAAVVAGEFRPGQLRLSAYYASDRPLAVDELAEFIGRFLPAYMVPSQFVRLPALPKSANEKVDRQKLRQMSAADGPSQEAVVMAPASRIEQDLLASWKKVLGTNAIAPDASFFTVGGDSILALELVSELAEVGYRLTPKDVFEHPTVAAQTRLLATSGRAKGQAEAGAEETVTGAVALTPIQHWFFAQRFRSPHHWHQSVELLLEFAVDREILAAALLAVYNKHDILRTTVRIRGQGIQQVIQGLLDRIDLKFLDASGGSGSGGGDRPAGTRARRERRPRQASARLRSGQARPGSVPADLGHSSPVCRHGQLAHPGPGPAKRVYTAGPGSPADVAAQNHVLSRLRGPSGGAGGVGRRPAPGVRMLEAFSRSRISVFRSEPGSGRRGAAAVELPYGGGADRCRADADPGQRDRRARARTAARCAFDHRLPGSVPVARPGRCDHRPGKPWPHRSRR